MRYSIVPAALLLMTSLPALAPAQIKLPVFDDAKGKYQNVVYQEASTRADYQHGKLVRVTMNGDQTVNGTLVRTDAAKGIVYVRTQPGTLPRAIAVNDIKRIEKGVIKEASYSGDITVPEIQAIEIFNGGVRSITYTAPTLSPSELSHLNELQTIANEMARLSSLARLEAQVIENSVAIQSEQRRRLELTNELLFEHLTAFGPYGYSSLSLLETGAWAQLAFFGAATNSISPVVAVPAAKAPTTMEALEVARRNYLAAQSRLIYENGQVVAVTVNEAADKK